jgi:esterase/lipase superfamily enzyme
MKNREAQSPVAQMKPKFFALLSASLPVSGLALAAILFAPSFATAQSSSKTDKYRVIWTEDPATKATIAWNQIEGEPATLHYDSTDHGRDASAYAGNQEPDRVSEYDGMRNCFVRLSGLSPDTNYYFCLSDESGTSKRFYFRTAPDKPQPFTFISGGDSRNFRDVRILANQFSAKLRPLFISFTGDMINKDEAPEWVEWLDDWQETTAEDGRMIPIVPHRGNHERRLETIYEFFDTPVDVYFSFDIGGALCRYYALNSEIPATGDQEEWLDADLKEHRNSRTHLIAGYHKPMRPHVSAKSEGENPMQWADNFYAHGLDLALESDSHVMKRTLPLKPDAAGHEGFSAAPDDPNATVYIGEGCWGAPLRAADDAKPWTIATESFNGFDWIEVTPEEIRIKTVKVQGSANFPAVDPSAPFETPDGVELWEPEGAAVLTIAADLYNTKSPGTFSTRGVTNPPKMPVTTTPKPIGAAPKEEESQNYHTVDVYYGTNRKPTPGEGNNDQYGKERNREGPVEYGRTTISIPLHHKIGVVERPKWYKLEFSEDPKKHVTIVELKKLGSDSFFSEVSDKAGERPKNEALLFIHGFNVPFDDAIRRTGQIAFDLDFGGVAMAYSWPSQGELKAYTIDEANAEWSIPHLTQFLIDLQEKTEIENIHVIAHSMGTRVLSYALANAKDEGFELNLHNVILAAPDIDKDVFTDQILPKITAASDKLTMYASSDDTALKLSQTIHGNGRLGLSGDEILVTPGMDTINASGIDTSMLGHGYYGSHKVVVADIFNLIIKGLEPPKRKLILGELGQWDFSILPD